MTTMKVQNDKIKDIPEGQSGIISSVLAELFNDACK